MVELLKGLLQANFLKVLFLLLTLICAVAIVLLEKPSKKDNEEEQKNRRRKKKTAISVFAIMLALFTLGDGVRLFFTSESLESWVPTQKANEVYERLPFKHPFVSSYNSYYYDDTGLTLDWVFDSVSIERFRTAYNEISSEKIGSFEVSEDQLHHNDKLYEYTFADSSRLFVSTLDYTNFSSLGIEPVRYFLFEIPLTNFEKNAFGFSHDHTVFNPIYDIAKAIDNVCLEYPWLPLDDLYGDPFMYDIYYKDLSRYAYSEFSLYLDNFPTTAYRDENSREFPYSLAVFNPYGEADFTSMSSEESLAYVNYPGKLFCIYQTSDSIKIYIVPYQDGILGDGIISIDSGAGAITSLMPPQSILPGDFLKITIMVMFLQDTTPGAELTAPRGLSLHASLPRHFKYIPKSTRITTWKGETTELPDGITTDQGLPMGTIMPDYDVKFVTFLVQLNPAKQLFAVNNAPKITARIQCGNSEIEQSVVLNVIAE